MPSVPLGLEAYQRSSAFQPEIRLVNLYCEKDESGASPDEVERLERPGLTRTATMAGSVRAIYQADRVAGGLPLVIAGTTLSQIDGTTITNKGALADDGTRARMVGTFERVAIATAGQFWSHDGTTLAQIVLPNGESIVDIDTLNGYIILAMESGTFYWLVPGTSVIDPLDFATAESLPDGIVAVRRLRDELFFFGANSVEVWQATGDADATFRRADGRLLERGCMSRDSVQIFDDTIAWVGENGIVYQIGNGFPLRISNFGIEERIKRRTGDPSAWVFTSVGHEFYCLTIPGEGTFAYDPSSKLWSEFASTGSTIWRAQVGQNLSTGGTLCGDSTGAIFTLNNDSALDDGVPMLRLVTANVALPSTPISNQSLSVGVGSNGAADFVLRYHDARQDWSKPVIKTARGDSDILNFWRLGLMRAPYRSYEISTVAPVKVRISGAIANEGWRV